MTSRFDFNNVVKSALAPEASPWRAFPAYNFVGGHNDPGSLSVSRLTEACNTVLRREGQDLATYFLQSGPQGYLPLREFLVGKLKKYAGINCTTDEIMLTSGSLQAIDLINAVLIKSGDTVVIEQSNYGGVLTRFERLGCNVVSVPVDQNGMQTDELHSTLQALADDHIKPAYIYTIPTVHNPTGSIMTHDRRHHLIDLAATYGVPIFEDECYADLVWAGERPAALHALSSSGGVIHVGSFSKTIAPALRVGYVVADWSLMGHLLANKTDAGSGALEQMLLAEYCQEYFDDHIKTLNNNLQRKLEALTNALDREFGTCAEYTYPPGGIFLWVKLPDSVDTDRLAAAASAEGVAINPGAEWSLQANARNHMRLCFANPSVEQIEDGVAKLADICFRTFGVPQRGQNRRR